jgi:cardiolipin synthase
MPFVDIVIVHLLPALGFALAIFLLARIITERRSPASALAWMMAIAFVPYAGVPLYLMFGGRKMRHMVHEKPPLPDDSDPEHLALHFGDPAFGQISTLMPERFHGVYPLIGKNRVVLLTSGEQAFDEAMHLIGEARQRIDIATFILGRDDTGRAFVDALAKKAAQGVAVHLLLDAVGCVKISRRFLSPLTDAGGATAFFMPMMRLPMRGRANLRNHRKMLIVDGEKSMVGGMNYSAEYMGAYSPKGHWVDISFMVEGPVVSQMHDIFIQDWAFAAKETISRLPHSKGVSSERQAALQLIASGPDVRTDTLREAIIHALFRARRRVWIVTPYFVPDQTLTEALCMAAHRGVDVRLIIPRRSNHLVADLARETYLRQLDEAGATTMYFVPEMLHAKAVVVDEDLAIVGSANMDMRSLLLNYEVALCVYTPSVVKDLEGWMRWLLARCEKRRPVTSGRMGIFQGLGRLLSPLL